MRSQVLTKVIEYSEHQLAEPTTEIDICVNSPPQMADVVQQWFADYFDIEFDLLFDLVKAANYMQIKPLEELTATAIDARLKSMTAEQIRALFNLADNVSPAGSSGNSPSLA